MTSLPPAHVRFYEDGPDWPKTPMQIAAEKAYREAFYTAVREASRLDYDELEDAITAAWNDRRKTREAAEVHVPSYVYLELPDRRDLDGDQIIYVAGHEPEAARARGRVQALEMAKEFYQELPDVPEEVVRAFVLKPWADRLEPWINEDSSTLVCPADLADVCNQEQRHVLDCFKPIAEKLAAESLLFRPRFRSARDLMLEFSRLKRPVIEGLLRRARP